ncbi:helix-turn-helix domain-containing protein [Methylomonas montana]|uniref:helix-turn-helix domain-containing protein n=1 Tax=Methylomonas montana TaxID=3058963 RepID=UPI00387E8FB9
MTTKITLDRETVTTKEAAAFLNRKVQTLHTWAWSGKGPVKPVKVGGRWAWRIDDLKAAVSGNAAVDRGVQ